MSISIPFFFSSNVHFFLNIISNLVTATQLVQQPLRNNLKPLLQFARSVGLFLFLMLPMLHSFALLVFQSQFLKLRVLVMLPLK
jgi:hypothetical protein